MVFPLPDFTWNAVEIIEAIATFVGYAVLVLGIGIAACAVIGIVLQGISRFFDWLHEARVHGLSGRKNMRRAGKR